MNHTLFVFHKGPVSDVSIEARGAALQLSAPEVDLQLWGKADRGSAHVGWCWTVAGKEICISSGQMLNEIEALQTHKVYIRNFGSYSGRIYDTFILKDERTHWISTWGIEQSLVREPGALQYNTSVHRIYSWCYFSSYVCMLYIRILNLGLLTMRHSEREASLHTPERFQRWALKEKKT